MQTKVVQITFPLKGISDAWARADQPELTTPDALNVWPDDRTPRARGSMRPGTATLFTADGAAQYRQVYSCDDLNGTGGADDLVPLWVLDGTITTPYDMLINREIERSRGANRHGSCGLGVSETVERLCKSPHRLFFRDAGFKG